VSTIESITRDIAAIARTSEMRDQRVHYRQALATPPSIITLSQRAASIIALRNLAASNSIEDSSQDAAVAEFMPRSRAERTDERERERDVLQERRML